MWSIHNTCDTFSMILIITCHYFGLLTIIEILVRKLPNLPLGRNQFRVAIITSSGKISNITACKILTLCYELTRDIFQVESK